MQPFLTNQNQEYRFKTLKRWTAYSIVFELILIIYLILLLPDSRFHIRFFDVGQGDSVFIQTPENHQILIDTGPDNLVLGELINSMPFFDRKIDMLILTHPDLDHIGGVIDVINRFDIDYLLFTGVPSESPQYAKFLDEISNSGFFERTKILFAYKPGRYYFGDFYFDLLFPFTSFIGEKVRDVNDTSTSILGNFEGHKMLLCGDISVKVEEILMQKYGSKLDSELLKANHHGSKGSNSLNFLQMVSPETVVVSVGKDNKFNHPHVEALINFYKANVANIFRTDEIGTVEIVY